MKVISVAISTILIFVAFQWGRNFEARALEKEREKILSGWLQDCNYNKERGK